MKLIDKYEEFGISTEEEGFNYLMSTLKQTIRSYDFFVAWDKVLNNVADIEIALHILNSLVGKDDVVCRFKELVIRYPEVVPVIPILFAERNSEFLIADGSNELQYSFKKRSYYHEEQIDGIVNFAEKCGLLGMLANKKIQDLVDYVIGVEVGLDTNARKNRSGELMERLVENYIKNICERRQFKYLTQATATRIKEEFGINVKTDKSRRNFDFVIQADLRVYLIEVNYYGGGGSKLKAVAGEFSNLSTFITNSQVSFIWITDGLGWKSAASPLFEAYGTIDHILNLRMIEDGFLEEILLKV
jgi:type II restriction enzyme